MSTVQLWAGLVMYLGVGVILGAVVLLGSGNLDIALGVGGFLALIGVGMYAYCGWKAIKAKPRSS